MAAANDYSHPVVSSGEDDDDNEDSIDQHSEGLCDGYSLSADVSESESSSWYSSSTSTLSSRRRNPPPQLDISSSDCDLSERPTLMFPVLGDRHVFIPAEKLPEKPLFPEVDLIKERFAKLLLGEDMSGGGNGVCTALAISNAITNLAATVFGELWKLKPLPPQKKSMWMREMEWLLCVCDSIIELVPSVQKLPGGRTFEVMVPQPRPDLSLNLPALKRLDAMLIGILDGFQHSEFCYVDRGIIVADGEYIEARLFAPSQGTPSVRLEEKWWLPFPKVPQNGLSEETRKQLQKCWKCANHIYKAAVAINSTVLSEMEVPKVYLDSLPKSAKACLGETLHRYVTSNDFPTKCVFDYLDLSSEHSTLEIANKLEAALHIWKQKYHKKDMNDRRTGESAWNGSMKGFFDNDKAKICAKRADTLLRHVKLQFPGLPQTSLETTKIQYNKDVGQAILESYSRVIESLAFNTMARIKDLVYVDDATRLRAAAAAESISTVSHRQLMGGALSLQGHVPPSPISIQLNSCASLLKKPPFCSAGPLVRKWKGKQGSPYKELEDKLERLAF